MKSSVWKIALVLAAIPVQMCFAIIHVDGKSLYTPCGEKIIIRGVEQGFGINHGENGWYIDEIAKTGANGIRMLPNLTAGQLSLNQVEGLFQKAQSYNMVVYISPMLSWDAASDERVWAWLEEDSVYTIIKKYEDIIIIDVVCEQNYSDEARWVSRCKEGITRLRKKGYRAPLCCMADGFGRNYTTVINKSAEVFAHDPLANTFFCVQAYWDQNWGIPKLLSTALIKEQIPLLAALPNCVQIGICPWAEGASCDNGYVDYKTAMSECNKYGLNWLVWDWHNPYEWSHVFSVTTSGKYGEWNNHCEWSSVNDCRDNGNYGCDYGYQICVGHEASIKNTAVRPSALSPLQCAGIRAAISTGTRSGAIPLTVSFDGSGSSGDALSFAWNFGEGTSGTGAKVSHTFASEGSYIVTLTVSSAKGTDQASVVVNAFDPARQPVLLSANAPAIASSEENSQVGGHLPASNAIDKDLSTRWSSNTTDNEWIYVDLGSTQTFNRVILLWETAYASSYKLQTSNDHQAWTDIYSTTTGYGGADTINISASARYVRMLGITRATEYGYSLYEFEVYQVPIALAAIPGFSRNSLAPMRSAAPAMVNSSPVFNVRGASISSRSAKSLHCGVYFLGLRQPRKLMVTR